MNAGGVNPSRCANHGLGLSASAHQTGCVWSRRVRPKRQVHDDWAVARGLGTTKLFARSVSLLPVAESRRTSPLAPHGPIVGDEEVAKLRPIRDIRLCAGRPPGSIRCTGPALLDVKEGEGKVSFGRQLLSPSCSCARIDPCSNRDARAGGGHVGGPPTRASLAPSVPCTRSQMR